MTAQVEIVRSVADVDGSFWERAAVHPARTRHQLLSLEADRRFETRYHLVRRGNDVTVLLPAYSALTASWSDPAYDVGTVMSGEPSDARDWVLIGGRSLVSSAPLVTDESPASDVAAAVACAAADARERGRRCAAVDVGGDDVAFRAGMADARMSRVVEVATRWDLPATGGLQDFLAAIPRARRRAMVQHDIAEAETHGLTAETEPYEDLIEEAAPLVAGTALRHGSPDDPDLVELRLAGWGSDTALTPVAWAVRARSGDLLGASFGWCVPTSAADPGTVDMHAIGVREGIERRGLVYRELSIMAPLRRAWADGLARVALGLDHADSKRMRGAVGTPVLAVSDHA